jgi:hypothetical protein
MSTATRDFVAGQSMSRLARLSAIAIAVLDWSILLWIKTGSPRLVLDTLIDATAINGCLLSHRDGNQTSAKRSRVAYLPAGVNRLTKMRTDPACKILS